MTLTVSDHNTTHTITYKATMTVQPDDGEPLSNTELSELAADSWGDTHLWTVTIDGTTRAFDPPVPAAFDTRATRAINALMDRYPDLGPIVARDYALAVLYAAEGRCSDCGTVLPGVGPECSGCRARSSVF